ncbi:hypothetical protein ACHAWF_016359 [Thalassiosira exigua]
MGLTAYLGDDAARIDAAEYEAELRSKDPRLLQSDERLVLAYRGQGGKGRDHRLFTSERYIFRDKRGMTGERVRYTSVPYSSVVGFSVETAGTVDTDGELAIYAQGKGKVSVDFVKDVDVVAIHSFLSSAVLRKRGGQAGGGGDVRCRRPTPCR